MFTLGSIGCPGCSTPLGVLDFTAPEDGLRATALLSCPSCRSRYELVATLTEQPAPAAPPPFVPGQPGTGDEPPLEHVVVELDDHRHPEPEPEPAPAPAAEPDPAPEPAAAPEPPADAGAFATGLVHVEGTPFDATAHRDADGRYPCPDCETICESPQGLAAHHRQHAVKVPCPRGCGKMVNPTAGMTRHLRTCPGAVEPAAAEPEPEPAPEPPPPAAAPAPRPAPRRGGRAPSATATAAARASAKERAAQRPRRDVDDEPERPTLPPLAGRSSWSCGFWMGPGAGACGIDKIDSDRGWKRARLPGGGYVDLCPAHRDASPAELRASLEHLAG